MCTCKNKNGGDKNLYYSRHTAQEQVDYTQQDRNKKLAIYKCPETNGWHLTSNLKPY